MTNFDELEGRKLDAAVHEALGYEVYLSKEHYLQSGMPHAMEYDANIEHPAFFDTRRRVSLVVPRYSDEHACKWPRILDAMEERGWGWIIDSIAHEEPYHASFRRAGTNPAALIVQSTGGVTVAEAVCRAALKALAAAP